MEWGFQNSRSHSPFWSGDICWPMYSAGLPPVASSSHVNGLRMLSTKRSDARFDCGGERQLTGEVPGDDDGAHDEGEADRAAPEKAGCEEQGDRDREQRDEPDLRARLVEPEVAVGSLQDRQSRCVVRAVLRDLVGRRQQQEQDERCCGEDGDRVEVATLEPDRRAREQQRCEVDQVALVRVRAERRRDVRRLDAV